MRLLALLLCLMQPACIYLRSTRQTYESVTPPPEAGGALFRAEFIPRGSEASMTVTAMVVGGAAITENGPYQLRLHAFGRPGDHRWFRVTRFELRVPGRLHAPMERRAFEGQTAFEATQTAGITRASLLFGTRVFINTEHKDQEVVIEADVEVMRRRSLSRGTIRIPLRKTGTARGESLFIPTEIARSFRAQTPADIPAALPPAPETAG
ncbi:MAG: hypothetical protein HS117_03895 [Verrucomicrobiaceae bacterium]|nr:hypothetical protein [Verrucomicrobiaceae bacterium]